MEKNGAKIFGDSFQILIPLVLISEVVTWFKYFDFYDRPPILNSIFLTGLLVSFCLGTCVYWLQKNKNAKGQESFVAKGLGLKYLAVANLFFVGLWEVLSQTNGHAYNFILITALLYSLYFTLAILIFNKWTLAGFSTKFFTAAIFILCLLIVSLPDFIESLAAKDFSYLYYLFYLIPLGFAIWTTMHSQQKTNAWNLRGMAFCMVYISCFELSHLYLIFNYRENLQNQGILQDHFIIFYLPMIWTLFGIAFIFWGLRKQIPEFIRIGFALIILMSLKLYLYDVWRMDNVSRIIAFIILGIVLLTSSFTFQKLKGLISHILTQKAKNDSISYKNNE